MSSMRWIFSCVRSRREARKSEKVSALKVGAIWVTRRPVLSSSAPKKPTFCRVEAELTRGCRPFGAHMRVNVLCL